MKQKLIRFIIITTPPLEIQREINLLRKEISEKAACIEALKYPPHLTLRTGAFVPENQIPLFFDSFEKHIQGLSSVQINTQGIDGGTYESAGISKHYFYYRIELTSELLRFHKKLLAFELYKKQEQFFYYPHLTLAFDDLSAQNFTQINHSMGEKLVNAPNYSWELDNIGFYIKKTNWEPFRVFKL